MVNIKKGRGGYNRFGSKYFHVAVYKYLSNKVFDRNFIEIFRL